MLMETIACDGEQSRTESRMWMRESEWVTIEKGKQENGILEFYAF